MVGLLEEDGKWDLRIYPSNELSHLFSCDRQHERNVLAKPGTWRKAKQGSLCCKRVLKPRPFHDLEHSPRAKTRYDRLDGRF